MGTTKEKLCSSCQTWLPLDEFKKDSRYMAGVFCWCKNCEREYASSPEVRESGKKRWATKMLNPRFRESERLRSNAKYRANPKKQKDTIYRRKYGITLSEFEKETQCALCFEVRKLVPDHNHETGEYRGPLCYRCNLAISQAEKHKNWMRRVAKYLRRD